MTSKQKVAKTAERQHAAAIDRQRQRAHQARHGGERQQTTNRIGMALCRAMLRGAQLHAEAKQSSEST